MTNASIALIAANSTIKVMLLSDLIGASEAGWIGARETNGCSSQQGEIGFTGRARPVNTVD